MLFRSQLCCIDSRESWGRDWLPLLEMNLNVGQKGKTSSDSEEVGLAIVDVGGPIFQFSCEIPKHLQNLKMFRPLS